MKATPGARELAETLGIDLDLVTGTGSSETITKRDVQNYKPAEAAKEEPPEEKQTEEIREDPPKDEKPKEEDIPPKGYVAEKPEEKFDKVQEIEVPPPPKVQQPKGVPGGEYNFNAEVTISDDNLNHLVRFRGKTRWMTRQGLIVTMRDPKVQVISDDSLTDAERLRQDIYYLEFPRYTLFTEKKT